MNFEHWRHYARGWLLHFFGRDESAFAAYTIAYRLQPNDVQAARHLASIAAGRKRFDIAEKWFKTNAAPRARRCRQPLQSRFRARTDGQGRRAISRFPPPTRLSPGLDRAWYGMGLAHARLGQHAEAAAAFAQAVELQPMAGEAFYQLAMAWHLAGERDEMAEVTERLVRFDPKRARKLVKDTERADLAHLIPTCLSDAG